MEIPRQLLADWVITPDALRGLADERTLALMARPGEPMEGANSVEIRPEYPSIAILHVKGALTRYAGWWGGTSYGMLLKDLQRCLDNPAIESIVWSFDSPGGEVNGCAETADAIYAARSKKPMKAYASYLCASGALWLASSVGEIQCASTALMGSVGVISYLYDTSKMMDDVGVKEFEIVASQSPNKSQLPADADYRARVQRRLDDTCDVFLNALARNYGVTAAYVQKNFGRGDVFVGARAVEANLAAGLSSFEAVLASMAKPAQTNIFQYTGVQHMDTKTMARLLKLDDSASERQIEDRAQSLAQLERSVLVATQSTDHDTAIGKIGASVSAVAERDAAKAALKLAEQAVIRSDFKAALKAAMKGDSPRVTLGQLPMIAELCLGDEAAAKAVAAMASVSEQERRPLLAAMCSVDITPKSLVRLKSYLAMQQPQLPTAKAEPPDDKPHRETVQAVSEADAAAAGIPIGRARELAAIRSAADLPPPVATEKKGV